MKKQGISHALVFLLLIVVLFRIPNLFEPYWYGDEGISLTLGQAIRHGLILYRDIHDNKTPLLYIIAAIAGTEFWFKFILLFWHLATIAVFFKLSELLLPQHPRAPVFASIFVAVLTMLPEGNIANGEIFMILPVIAGMLSMMKASSIKHQASNGGYFLAGLFFAAGFLFKVPAVFDFAGAFVFLTLFQSATVRGVVQKIFSKQTVSFSAGFFFPIILSIAYYANKGALAPYLRSALLQNIGYLGSWSAGTQDAMATMTHSGLFLRTVLLGLSTLLLWRKSGRLKFSIPFQFSVLWFLFALYGALLSERPYPHYLIQPAVPGALLLALFIYEKQRATQTTILMLGAIGIFSYFNIGFWQYPVLSYYQNFLNWTLKRETTEQYFSYFGDHVNRTYEVAKLIKLMTKPDDRIFIWGDEPMVYAASDRLPVGRYTVAYHIADFNGYDETIKAIQEKKPSLVVIFSSESRPFPQLFFELSSHYTSIKKIDDAIFFKRIK